LKAEQLRQEKKMDEPSCKSCSFFMTAPEQEGAQPSQAGWCRRFPPTVLWIDSPNNMRNPDMQPDVHSFMPAVHEEIWCGEFKFKGSGKSKKGKSK
jgi:hypothetical protein